uniref:Uncharacterized protein n=1 Tax=Buteo japonicus TaxID=224669 RepID=A0A8C0HNM9_9AVES
SWLDNTGNGLLLSRELRGEGGRAGQVLLPAAPPALCAHPAPHRREPCGSSSFLSWAFCMDQLDAILGCESLESISPILFRNVARPRLSETRGCKAGSGCSHVCSFNPFCQPLC